MQLAERSRPLLFTSGLSSRSPSCPRSRIGIDRFISAPGVIQELEWRQSELQHWNDKSAIPQKHQHILTTNASGLGWGVVTTIGNYRYCDSKFFSALFEVNLSDSARVKAVSVAGVQIRPGIVAASSLTGPISRTTMLCRPPSSLSSLGACLRLPAGHGARTVIGWSRP